MSKADINRAAVLAVVLLTSGCASAQGDYPSLAVRENERVTGSLDAPTAPPFVPAPATPATLESLGELTATASMAHQAFLAEANAVTPVVSRASGSAVGSDAWAQAQVAIAGLESRRSVAMIALADIDRLYVDAVTNGSEAGQIADSRAIVSNQIGEQDAQIAALLGRLTQ